MAGRYPKADGERVNRSRTTLGWVELPAAGRTGRPPPLPDWRVWDPRTVAWWTEVWRKPQAVMWDQDGSTLRWMALLVDSVLAGALDAKDASGEIRQYEAIHGLNPKAMLQLRWKIADRAPAPPAKTRATKAASARAVSRRVAAMKEITGAS